MNVEKTTRFFILAYPLFVLALIAWGWFNYRGVAALREELENVRETAQQQVNDEGDDVRITEKDVDMLNSLAAQWRNKLERRASEVPVMLQNLTRSISVHLSDYRSSGKITDAPPGFVFEEGETTVRGTFHHLLAFLNALENHPDFFVEITSVNFRPARENEVHEIRVTLRVLLDSIAVEEEG